MAKHDKNHPGVSVYPKGKTLCIRFFKNGLECRKSLKTSDYAEAQKIAQQVYDYLHGKIIEVPNNVRALLGITPLETEIQTVLAATSDLLDDLNATHIEPNDGHYAAINRAMDLAQTAEGLKNELSKIQLELVARDKKISQLEAILHVAGEKSLDKIAPKTLQEACTEYITKGTRGLPSTVSYYSSVLKSFQSVIGSNVNLSDIHPDSIIAYYETVKATLSPETLRKTLAITIAALDFGSNGSYPVKLLKNWRKFNLKMPNKLESDFFWLTETQVLQLAEHACNDYWRDCILVQFYLALRPSELCSLQSANVQGIDTNAPSIYIDEIRDDTNNVIRGVKTPQSRASLQIAQAAVPAIKRRLATGNKFLFSRSSIEIKMKNMQFGSEYEKLHNVWHYPYFCNNYIKILRNAATRAGLEAKKIDCRTLRRSRARDLIIRNNSLEKAATFLRDSIAMVNKHYGRWVTKDTKVD
jgi:integrase